MYDDMSTKDLVEAIERWKSVPIPKIEIAKLHSLSMELANRVRSMERRKDEDVI